MTGRSSIPEAFASNRDVTAYWVARSSRAMTSELKNESRRNHLAPAVVLTNLNPSVQLGANFGNALGQEIVGDRSLHRLRQDGRGRGYRGVGRGGADIGQCLGFGERDLALSGLGAPGDEIVQLGPGFGGDALGFGPGG